MSVFYAKHSANSKNKYRLSLVWGILMVLLLPVLSWGQNANGNYRTRVASGNWSTASSWQIRSGGTWATATTVPGSSDVVSIQSGHTISVDVDSEVGDVHIQTSAVIACGTRVLSVYGKIRAYTGIAVVGSGDASYTSSTSPTVGMITCGSGGRLKFVGNTRNLTNSGEWGTTGLTTSAVIEFALTDGQIGTLGTGFKALSMIFTSGTISTAFRIAPDGVSTGTGTLVMNGGTLISSQTGTGSGCVISRTNGTACASFTMNSGSTLRLTGASPTIDAASITLNGTIEYTGTNQTFLTTGGGTSAAAASAFQTLNNVTLGTSGTKTTVASSAVTINGKLSMQGSAALALGTSGTLAYGASSTLEYASSTANQTTTSVEWLASGAAPNVTINNTFGGTGVTLHAARTVAGVLTVTSGTFNTGGFDLTLDASTGSAVIDAAGVLNISGGTTDFNGRSVTFKSTASGTGYLANVAGTLNDATNVTVERFISAASNQAYRLLTPGVTTSTSIRANWQENTNNTATDYVSNSNPNPGYGTHITGSADGSNGFDATTNGNLAGAKSLYTYTPGNPGSWTAVANTNSNTLSATTGYLLYVRGSRNVNLTQTNAQNITNGTHGNTTLRATGTLQTGTINIPTSIADNFVLVANPYAAPLRWDATTGAYSLANNSTNFENYVTIWDPNQAGRGGYVTVTAAGVVAPSAALTQNLQTGQAFFVKVKTGVVGTPDFIVQESHKATSNSLDAFRVGAQQELLRAGLFFTHTDNSRRQADGVVTVYDNNYSAAFDGNDAMQIANWDEDVAIVSNNKELSIESRPLADNGDTIFFNMARLREMNYEWEFVAENFNAPGLTAYVQDAFTNTETAISLSGTTVVPFTVTSNAASKAANRFRVVYRTSGVLPVTLTNVKAFQQNNGITVAWNTQSESGMQQYEVEKSANGTSFSKVNTTPAKAGTSNSYNYFDATPINGANYYRIKAISLNGDVKYSTIVVVRLGDKGTTLSVYPNPVKGNTISIALNGLNKGNYTLSVFNQLGQQVLNRVVAHNGGNATQTIDLGKLSAGLYELRLSNGETVLTEKLIKE